RQLDGRPDSGPGPRRVGGRPPLLPAVRSCAGDPAGSDHTAPGSGRGPRSARGPHLGRRDAAAQRPRGRRAPGYRDDRAGLAAGKPAVRVGLRLQLVLAAACFSTAGAAIKGSGFDAGEIAAVRAVDLAFMGVLALGLALLFVGGQRHFATAPDPILGNVLAAGSALAWAFTVTGYRWLARRGGADHGPIAAAAACGNLIVFLVCLPGALPLAAGRATDWLIVIYLGVFQLGLAYVFLSRAITRVPALEASLFLLVEPVLSPVWAWLAHGETPGPLAVLGGAVILPATTLKAWTDTQVVAA